MKVIFSTINYKVCLQCVRLLNLVEQIFRNHMNMVHPTKLWLLERIMFFFRLHMFFEKIKDKYLREIHCTQLYILECRFKLPALGNDAESISPNPQITPIITPIFFLFQIAAVHTSYQYLLWIPVFSNFLSGLNILHPLVSHHCEF